MSPELSTRVFDHAAPEEAELFECLQKIGKGLIASGTEVGVFLGTLIISPDNFIPLRAQVERLEVESI